MLWRDFAKEECCDNCPLLENEICTGGFVCYGGQPIEPPCASFDEDTDLDEWVSDYFEQQKRREEMLKDGVNAVLKERADEVIDRCIPLAAEYIGKKGVKKFVDALGKEGTI